MSSWLTPAENQAANTEIRSQTAARIVQDFLQAQWDYSEIAASSIAWGYHGRLLGSRSGKSITLQCIPVIDNVTKEDVTRRVMRFDETVRIDVYLRDEASPAAYSALPPKLTGMMRYIQGFIEANMHALYVKGISGMELLRSQAVPADPTNPNGKIYHVVVTLHVWYRMINEHPASV